MFFTHHVIARIGDTVLSLATATMDSRRTSQPARSVVIASVLAAIFVVYLWATYTSPKEPFVYRVRAYSWAINLASSFPESSCR